MKIKQPLLEARVTNLVFKWSNAKTILLKSIFFFAPKTHFEEFNWLVVRYPQRTQYPTLELCRLVPPAANLKYKLWLKLIRFIVHDSLFETVREDCSI